MLAYEVAGAGNGATDTARRARRGKPRIQPSQRPDGPPRQFPTLQSGAQTDFQGEGVNRRDVEWCEGTQVARQGGHAMVPGRGRDDDIGKVGRMTGCTRLICSILLATRDAETSNGSTPLSIEMEHEFKPIPEAGDPGRRGSPTPHDGGQGCRPGGCFGEGDQGLGNGRGWWSRGSPQYMNDNILYHALATSAPAAPRQAIMPDRSLTYSRAGGVRNSFPILLVSTV